MSANLPPDEPERPTGDTAETRQMSGGDPPPPRGRLLRSRSDRMIAGVAGGLGRYFGIDPVIVRIAIVVLTFFGGAGALLYLAAILLVPNEDEVEGAAGTAAAGPPERNRGLVILGVVLLVLVAGPLLFGPALVAGGIIVPFAFLVVVGLAVSWAVTGRRPERDAGSILRATLLGLALVLLLTLLAFASFWGAGVGGGTVVAIMVIAAGVVLVAAAFVRPVRWLILPALAVALPAAFVAAAGIDLDGGVGERTYRPGSAQAVQDRYEIGAGRLVLDLRGADLPAGTRHVEIDVGMGEAVVIVPEDVCVSSDADIGIGHADVFERGSGGIDVDWVDHNTPRPGNARLVLDADVGIGHLDVRRTDPDRWDRGDEARWNRHWDDGPRGTNSGCER
jgi:phage shock protein PspC (stress-responsive transcriptional regulator)